MQLIDNLYGMEKQQLATVLAYVERIGLRNVVLPKVYEGMNALWHGVDAARSLSQKAFEGLTRRNAPKWLANELTRMDIVHFHEQIERRAQALCAYDHDELVEEFGRAIRHRLGMTSDDIETVIREACVVAARRYAIDEALSSDDIAAKVAVRYIEEVWTEVSPHVEGVATKTMMKALTGGAGAGAVLSMLNLTGPFGFIISSTLMTGFMLVRGNGVFNDIVMAYAVTMMYSAGHRSVKGEQ